MVRSLYLAPAESADKGALELVVNRLVHLTNVSRKLRRVGTPSSPLAYLVCRATCTAAALVAPAA